MQTDLSSTPTVRITPRQRREHCQLVVWHPHLPVVASEASPPLLITVGGAIMALVLVVLVALTPWLSHLSVSHGATVRPSGVTGSWSNPITADAMHPRVATNPDAVSVPLPQWPRRRHEMGPPKPTARADANNPVASLAPPGSHPDRAVQTRQQTLSRTLGDSSVTPASAETTARRSPERDARTVSAVARLQSQIDSQNEALASDHQIIAVLVSKLLDSHPRSSALQPLQLPSVSPPQRGRQIAVSQQRKVSAKPKPKSKPGDAHKHHAAQAVRRPGPWPDWHVFGMSNNAVMLRDDDDNVRVVRVGDSFLGVRLLKLDSKKRVAHTSAGAVTYRPHRESPRSKH
jgi:hypothetical protein